MQGAFFNIDGKATSKLGYVRRLQNWPSDMYKSKYLELLVLSAVANTFAEEVLARDTVRTSMVVPWMLPSSTLTIPTVMLD